MVSKTASHPSWEGYQINAWRWSWDAVATICVFARFWVDYKGLRKIPLWRDALLFIGLLCELGSSAMVSWMTGANEFNFYNKLSDTDRVTVKKMSVPLQITAFSVVYFCKVDLLLLYHGLAPRAVCPKEFLFIVFGWAVTISGFLMMVLYSAFHCHPYKLNWAYPQAECAKTSNNNVWYAWVPHMITDVIIYLIPCVIIYNMKKLTGRQKLGAAAMFIIGFINVLSSTFDLALFETATPMFENKNDTLQNIFWAWNMEGAALFFGGMVGPTALIVVCMPQLKTFWGLLSPSFQKLKVIVGRRSSSSGDDEGKSESDVGFPAGELAVYPSKPGGVHTLAEVSTLSQHERRVGGYEAGSDIEKGSP